MIAQIIPLVRLPRRFAHFDYLIPDHLPVEVGDFVRVSFKGREVNAIVIAVESKSDVPITQEVREVLESHALGAQDIERLRRCARLSVCSPSSLFSLAMAGHDSRYTKPNLRSGGTRSGSLDKASVEAIKQALHAQTQRTTLQCGLEGTIGLVRALQKQPGQTLVLCPRERDVELLSEFLVQSHAILHGKISQSHRAWIRSTWRSGELPLLLSTRQGSLLAPKNLTTIVLYDPHSADHGNYSRNPRYDARLAVDLLATQTGARLISCSALPLLEDVASPFIDVSLGKPVIVALSDPSESSGIPLVSSSLLHAISNALQNQKSVLLSFNAKGVAKRLQCKACGHLPTCGTCGAQPCVRLEDLLCPVCSAQMWIPNHCPKCGKKTLSTRGIGNQKVLAELQKTFPRARVAIVDKEHISPKVADILLVTEHYFQSVYEPFGQHFGLVAELCADILLHADYEAQMQIATRLHRLRFIAHTHKAQCLVQTWIPELITSMTDAKSFLVQECEQRKRYGLSPYTTLYTIQGQLQDIPLSAREGMIPMNEHFVLACAPDRQKTCIERLSLLPDSVHVLSSQKTYDTSHCHHTQSNPS